VERRITIRRQEQAHLALAAPSLPFHHPDRYALNVLNNILGGGVSSRLFQEIREKRGLAYGASSGLEAFHDAGLLMIHTSVAPAKFKEAARVIGEILDTLADKGPTEAEVARGREQLKGNVFLALESTSSRMGRLAMSRMYLGRVAPMAEVMAQVDAVTTATVKRLARTLLDPRRFTAAILGPGSPALYRVPWLAATGEASA
jgi:predicted Zn-dependent peptidase